MSRPKSPPEPPQSVLEAMGKLMDGEQLSKAEVQALKDQSISTARWLRQNEPYLYSIFMKMMRATIEAM